MALALRAAIVLETEGTVRFESPLVDAKTYDDHRVAMTFGILGVVVDGVEIEDPTCVAKSFPEFWNELDRFRAHHGSLSAR